MPLQQEIISRVIARKDTLVLMATGGGKSLCYQLPALCFSGLTIVVSPLIALMKDQVDRLKSNSIAAEFINSTLTGPEAARVQEDARKGRLKILYVAPERLALPRFHSFLCSLNVSLIAIDDAHCISEWGHDFRPDYRNLKTLRRDFPAVPMIALTATAIEEVRSDIIAQLGLQRPDIFISGFNRPNLTYVVRPKSNSFGALLELLRKHDNGSAIIYCFSRKATEAMAEDLAANGFKAQAYHAGLDRSVRRETQEKFIHGEVPIVVATIAFGMGIDKPDIRLVVHYDLPKSIEGYYQETGRAGRDGLPSECVLFYSYADKIKHEHFTSQIENEAEQENARQKLDQMVAYCELQTCRRRYLLEYFGEKWEDQACGGCDTCVTPREEYDGTQISQKVLSAVIRTGERFGAVHISNVLRGAATKQVRSWGHDRLTVFGIARDFSKEDLAPMIRVLIAKGLLTVDGNGRPTLAVTSEGRAFLKSRDKLTLNRPKPVPEAIDSASRNALPSKSREIVAPQPATDLLYDPELFEKLRALRKKLADERNVPTFVVFHDTTLQQIASRFPQNRDEFARISGVGRAKLEHFSEAFLALTNEHAGAAREAGYGVPVSRHEMSVSITRPSSTLNQTKALVSEKLSISEMAQRRGLTGGTIISHLTGLVMGGVVVDLDHLMPPPDRLANITAAFRRSEDIQLTPVRELLGDAYSYEEIHLARIGLMQRGIIVRKGNTFTIDEGAQWGVPTNP